ncbi:MAG TPA: pitrilysin family protein [Dehalococcoidia bacterium]|nr:pitrilysin family protein [Dehalococcoidia bacterium]
MTDNSFYQRTTLPNGLRILTAAMPHTHSVSLSLYVGTGSRYERDEEAGVSHFLEHLLFKGTERWPTAKEVAETVDGVGGLLNGGTDREYTVYYIKVARPHLQIALDVLMELVRKPLLDPGEMEKERSVILEELAMVADSPPQLVDLLLDSLLFPENPLGRDVAGTPESVSGINRDMVINYLGAQYVPNNVVFSIAGNITHDEIVKAVTDGMGDWKAGLPARWAPAAAPNGVRRAVKYKTTEQAHVSLAVPAIPLDHPDRHALSFLSVILGEGMSSRLFMELREKRGLVYDVHTYVAHFLDTGTFNVYTGVDPKKAQEAVSVIVEELQRLSEAGVTEAELTKARELSKGRLLLRMEDTRNVGGWIGAQELLLGTVRSVDQAVAEMDAVTLEDMQRVARDIIDPEKLYLAVVGPYRSDKRFSGLLPA